MSIFVYTCVCVYSAPKQWLEKQPEMSMENIKRETMSTSSKFDCIWCCWWIILLSWLRRFHQHQFHTLWLWYSAIAYIPWNQQFRNTLPITIAYPHKQTNERMFVNQRYYFDITHAHQTSLTIVLISNILSSSTPTRRSGDRASEEREIGRKTIETWIKHELLQNREKLILLVRWYTLIRIIYFVINVITPTNNIPPTPHTLSLNLNKFDRIQISFGQRIIAGPLVNFKRESQKATVIEQHARLMCE